MRPVAAVVGSCRISAVFAVLWPIRAKPVTGGLHGSPLAPSSRFVAAPAVKINLSSGTLRDREKSQASRHRVPGIPILGAFASGISLDHACSLPQTWWLTACCATWVCWYTFILCHRNRAASVPLLLTCGLLGGAWHHFSWSIVAGDELVAFAEDRPQPVKLIARIIRAPRLVLPPVQEAPQSLQKTARLVSELSAQSLDVARQIIPVSGRVRWEVRLPHSTLDEPVPADEWRAWKVGTEVEVLGSLSLPSGVRNPAGFDFRLYLREQGIRTIIRSPFPACARILRPAPFRPWNVVYDWQNLCIRRLRESLWPEASPLAIAMLLGPRTDISEELRDAFLKSGTIHFLAISGMNVLIFASFLWFLIRGWHWPLIWQITWAGTGVWAYVLATDADPPVMRAALLFSFLLLSLLSGYRASPINHLVLSALLIVSLNPRDLFQVGAQLSFLAIVAIHWLWSQSWFNNPEPPDPLTELERSWWGEWLNNVSVAIWNTGLTTLVVWAFTLPLVLARFQLISPIGLIVNIGLSAYMTLTLYAGYFVLLTALLLPWIGWIPGTLFSYLILLFQWIIEVAAAVPGGHLTVPGPPDFWLLGCYSLLVPLGTGLLTHRQCQIAWKLLALWGLAGLAWGIPPATNLGLKCTVLAVGHGSAILLELPDRRTLLCDAGSLEDASRASQAVQAVLAERGYAGLDAIIISHADVDHYNAVPELLENCDVKALYFSPTFLDFSQPGVVQTCESAARHAIPMRLLWSGDKLRTDPQVEIEVLHPSWPRTSFLDNANSIVLSVRYAGQRLLLTGDLEKEGLSTLLKQPSLQHTLLLSPHHGSLKANPPELGRWAAPRWVIVSGGHDTNWAKLEENYGAGVTILSTARQGAITLTISPSGQVDVDVQSKPSLP